ncbi:MAG: hypothetical protein CL677_06100 [Bdellovibrionaceae bacterium]|nr:hypothetical protein [Pseudobdellovibrionaceae bacterium]
MSKKENKNVTYNSLRVKNETKALLQNLLTKINKNEDCGKITSDKIIHHLVTNVTNEDIKALQLESITWEHEDRRLKKLWEKKKGKISESKWKEMLYIGQLAEFINEHSRLKVRTNA